ncbi:hypothetical protein KCP75_17870 [Salmonella enterica subsp. enterica]|nr:hypothetical protein KCP75_17870 [Salmonella enterica subsp. enterica]
MPHTECVAGDEQKQFTVRGDISELVRRGRDLMVPEVMKDPLGERRAFDHETSRCHSFAYFYACGVTRWRFPAHQRR